MFILFISFSYRSLLNKTTKTPGAGFIHLFIVQRQFFEYFLKYRGACEVRRRIRQTKFFFLHCKPFFQDCKIQRISAALMIFMIFFQSLNHTFKKWRRRNIRDVYTSLAIYTYLSRIFSIVILIWKREQKLYRIDSNFP